MYCSDSSVKSNKTVKSMLGAAFIMITVPPCQPPVWVYIIINIYEFSYRSRSQ